MYKHLVEILEDNTETNGYNQQLRQSMRHIAYIYCQRTEAGGRENLYASRIVHENQCVYTTRMRSGIAAKSPKAAVKAARDVMVRAEKPA